MQDDILRRRDLTLAAKVVHAVIVDSMRGSESVRIGVRSIMARTALSPATVVSAIKRLEAVDLIRVEYGMGGRANTYLRNPAPRALQNCNASSSRSKTEALQNDNAARFKKCNGSASELKHSTEQTRQTNSLSTESRAPAKKPRTKRPAVNRVDTSWDLALVAMETGALKTDIFLKAWTEWFNHRAEKRSALTATTIRYQIRRLEKWGHDAAIASITRSLENGYLGLFEPKDGQAKPRTGRAIPPPGKYDDDD